MWRGPHTHTHTHTPHISPSSYILSLLANSSLFFRHASNLFTPDLSFEIYTLNSTCLRYRPLGFLAQTTTVCSERVVTQPSTPHTRTWLSSIYSLVEFVLLGAARFGSSALTVLDLITGWHFSRLAYIPRLLILSLQYFANWLSITCRVLSTLADIGDGFFYLFSP